jgi:hypothetical protein
MQPAHSPRRLDDPRGWMLYLAHRPPARLVVFVHGFGGEVVSTWQHFPDAGREWWLDSDLLFVGYDSRRDNITGTAARIRRYLPMFYPHLPGGLAEIRGVRVREASDTAYGSLALVGHSLGGVILRRVVCDWAEEWGMSHEAAPDTQPPPFLASTLTLFSPASAGFRPAGALGIFRATPAWRAINIYLRRSSAYTDLLPGSPILADTRARTEALVAQHGTSAKALRARILWANPDNVVITERYHTDFVDQAADGTDHRSVCKPHGEYEEPWLMVETGVAR